VRASFTLLSAFILFTSQLQAQTLNTESRWLDRKAEGYFWYKDQFEPEKEKPKKKEPPKAPQVVVSVPAGPAPLSSAWLRENMQHYLDNAVDNPTVENISAYLLIQKHAMDKSFTYMDATEAVTLGNPMLDEINKRPLANFAKKELDLQATENKTQVINKISQKAGLFVFLDSSTASTAQSTIIDMLKRNHNFSIINIAVEPLAPDNTATNIQQNKGHAAQLMINNIPAIVMLRDDGVFDYIAQAPVSYSNLQKRILVSAKRLAVITEDEFNSTRPIRNISFYTPSTILASPGVNNKLPISANEIVNAFKPEH